MTILPLFIAKASKNLFHSFRETAYEDMAHQASDWIPEESRIEKPLRDSAPITLDFTVPKKRRLDWIRRTMHHLPH